jgi:hypothetical protein
MGTDFKTLAVTAVGSNSVKNFGSRQGLLVQIPVNDFFINESFLSFEKTNLLNYY